MIGTCPGDPGCRVCQLVAGDATDSTQIAHALHKHGAATCAERNHNEKRALLRPLQDGVNGGGRLCPRFTAHCARRTGTVTVPLFTATREDHVEHTARAKD